MILIALSNWNQIAMLLGNVDLDLANVIQILCYYCKFMEYLSTLIALLKHSGNAEKQTFVTIKSIWLGLLMRSF